MNLRRVLLQLAVCISLGLAVQGAAAQQFQQPALVSTENWPAGIVTADVNGDNKPDLIVTDYGATATASITHVLINNGDGTFRPGPTLATAGTAIAAADFDDDGSIDLEWVWSVEGLGKVFFAQGNGDGTFHPAVELGTFAQIGTRVPQFSYVMAAKMHDSGYLDLLVEDVANSAVFELTADSSGTLVRLAGTQLPDGAGPMATMDLNGDGHTDLLVQSLSGRTIDVLLGSSDGLIQPAARVPGASSVQSFLVHDVDGDSHPDLLLETTAGDLQVLHGNPEGTFASPISANGSVGHLIAINGQYLYTASATGITASLLDASLIVKPQGVFNAGPGRTSFAVADFNDDGTQDIALDSPEGIALLFANSDGTLRSSQAFSAGKPALSGVLGSFSDSGHLDAVISIDSAQAQLLRGKGDGTFTAISAPTTPQTGDPTVPSTLLAADFNGDGNLDLAITKSGSSLGPGVALQYGNGDGTFTPPVPIPGSLSGHSVLASFSGSTDLANAGSEGQRLLVSPFNGTFSVTDLASSASPSGLSAAGDLNHDTKADLISLNGTVWDVYLNSGTGSLSLAGSLPGIASISALVPSAIAIADLDGDGNGDVIALYDDPSADHAHPGATINNRIDIWYGRGDGSFDAPTVLTPSRDFYQLAIVDLDGDGRPDLALSDGYLLSTLRNLGSRTFDAERHWLAGMGINAISAGDVNQDGATDIVIANGGGVLSGLTSSSVSVDSNSDINTGGITVLLNHLDLRTVTGILSAPTATAYGQPFSILATVSAGSNDPVPTGTISFFIDGAPFGTAPLIAGAASIAAPATMTVGTHTLTARYSGDQSYAAATLGGAHAVTGIPSSIVLTMTTPSSIAFGQLVDGYATITSADNSSVTGTITFYDGSRNICVVSAAKKQSCPAAATTGLAAGTHVMTAVYSGDTTHANATSNAINVIVTPDSTTATLASSATTSQSGQAVTFTASLHGSNAIPSGTVTFLDGASLIGTAMLDASGSASLVTSTLPAGTHTVSASYTATQNFSATSSKALNITVKDSSSLVQTAAMISSTANPAIPGQSVTFTADVVTVGPSLRTPTGTVTFFEGSTILATVPLDTNGLALWTATALPVGAHNIVASYGGDSTSAASVSPTFAQVVNSAPPTVQASFIILASNASVYTGTRINLQVEVSPLNGFKQPVQLGCANLPTDATCTFPQSTVPAGGGIVTLQLSTLAPHACGSGSSISSAATSMSLGGPVFAGLLLFFVPRRHRAMKGLLLALVAITSVAMITGCGACTDLGTRPGTYRITITGQSTGTTQARATQQIEVTVHN